MPSRMLLIDDDQSGLKALSEALPPRLPETVIDTALDTHAALAFLRAYDYHVVVSDLRMAGLDGLALLNQVRERWPETQVVLVTATGRDREAEALRSGAFALIEKPVDLDHLVSVLQAAMDRKDLHRRVRQANRFSLSKL
jgi:two-component system response regulator GlrR